MPENPWIAVAVILVVYIAAFYNGWSAGRTHESNSRKRARR